MLQVEFCLHTFPVAGRLGGFPSLQALANGFGTANIAKTAARYGTSCSTLRS